MGDTISRQDAIDAAKDWYDGLICGTFAGLEKRLKLVPPASEDGRLKAIAELVDGTIDHFDLDDAMDLLYQIKNVLKGR